MPTVPSVRVLPNPSFVCDADGNPTCAIPFPDDPSGFIGATRHFVAQGGATPGHPDRPVGVYRFVFDESTPVEVFGAKSIATVKRHVKDGELFPADEASAVALGVAWSAPKITQKKASAQPVAEV